MAPPSKIPVPSGAKPRPLINKSRLPQLSNARQGEIPRATAISPPLLSCSITLKSSRLPIRIKSQDAKARTVSIRSMIPVVGVREGRRSEMIEEGSPSLSTSPKDKEAVPPLPRMNSLDDIRSDDPTSNTKDKMIDTAEQYSDAGSVTNTSSIDYYNYRLQFQGEDDEARRQSRFNRDMRIQDIMGLFDKLSSELKGDLERLRNVPSENGCERYSETVWWNRRYFPDQGGSAAEQENWVPGARNTASVSQTDENDTLGPDLTAKQNSSSKEEFTREEGTAGSNPAASWKAKLAEYQPKDRLVPRTPRRDISTVPLRPSSLRNEIHVWDDLDGMESTSEEQRIAYERSSSGVSWSGSEKRFKRAKKLLTKVQHQGLIRSVRSTESFKSRTSAHQNGESSSRGVLARAASTDDLSGNDHDLEAESDLTALPSMPPSSLRQDSVLSDSERRPKKLRKRHPRESRPNSGGAQSVNRPKKKNRVFKRIFKWFSKMGSKKSRVTPERRKRRG